MSANLKNQRPAKDCYLKIVNLTVKVDKFLQFTVIACNATTGIKV